MNDFRPEIKIPPKAFQELTTTGEWIRILEPGTITVINRIGTQAKICSYDDKERAYPVIAEIANRKKTAEGELVTWRLVQ